MILLPWFLTTTLGCMSADAPTPSVPEPSSPAPPAALPSPSIDGIPGWLGVKVEPAGSEAGLVLDGAGPIVVLSDAWSSVSPGTTVLRVDHTGTAPTTLLQAHTVPFGCDGGRTLPVASFAGPASDPLVWLLPQGETAVSLPVTRADTATTRSWTVAGQTLQITMVAPDKVELRAPDLKTVLHATDLATQRMDGDEDSHLDLRADFLVPQLDAAWSIGGTTVVAGRYASYEGDHYVAYILGAVPREVEVNYLYRCAF